MKGDEPLGTGELAAFATAVCWTVTVMAFETAGRKVGSLPVNLIRLLAGLIFLSVYCAAAEGRILPLDAGTHRWFWLGLSGIVGFVVGDLCLFRAFVLIGSRISMVIYALVPPATALAGLVFLNESLSLRNWMGISVTVTGISMVILVKESRRVKLAHPVKGIMLALGGTLGQAAGLVLSKYGVGDYSAFAATQIRIIAAVAVFAMAIPLSRRTGRVRQALKNPSAMRFIALGSFFGPFLGVSLSLLAVQHINVGVASTIMAMVPVFIMIPERVFLGKSFRGLEIAGAFLAVSGVALVTV